MNSPNPERNETLIVEGIVARPTFDVMARVEALMGKSTLTVLSEAGAGQIPPVNTCVGILHIAAVAAGHRGKDRGVFGEMLMQKLKYNGIIKCALDFLSSAISDGGAEKDGDVDPMQLETK